MSYSITLKGWLATFIMGVARETDARTGSRFAPPILEMVAAHSPLLSFDWTLAELRSQVSAILS